MSIPGFLVPEGTVTANGAGPSIALDSSNRGVLEVTLGILEVLEQQSLDVGIHVSSDGAAWSPKPVAAFPQKFYVGTSSILVDLGQYPEATHVRIQWKVNRWGHWQEPAQFRFFVFAQRA
jgi:hypothetical protein